MLSNYILVAVRNIRRHKLFSFINIFGLALSLSFCFLVIMIIRDQNSFDSFHQDSEELYRVLTIAHRKSGGTEPYATSPQPLGDALAAQSPGVEQTLTLSEGLRGEVVKGLSAIHINGFFVSPGFFDVFGFELSKGNPSTALSQPNNIVLTQETADKLFEEGDPLGQTVAVGGLPEFTVTGVLKEVPGKTHLRFDAMGSSTALPLLDRDRQNFQIAGNWRNYYSSYTYVKLRKGQAAATVKTVLESISQQVYPDLKLETRDQGYSFDLQSLTHISPGPILSNEISQSLPEPIIFFISLLAFVGIVAALFNYTSLTLARSLTRAKEVGLRKVVGASRLQVFFQFVSESIVSACLALVIAIVLLQGILIPGFERLSFMREVDLDLDFKGVLFSWFAAFTALIGGLAGFLPALLISRFNPAFILRGLSKVKIFSAITPRMALVLFQFVLSLVLIIVLTTAVRQIDFAMNPPNGFETRNMVSIDLQGHPSGLVATEMKKHPEVESITAISHHMGTWEDSSVDVKAPNSKEPIIIKDYSVDENFVEHYGLSLVAGSDFRLDAPELNKHHVLVNEKFLDRLDLGLPGEAVGTTLTIEDVTTVQIVGVVKDFLYKPLSYELAPMLLRYDPENWRSIDIRLHGQDEPGAVRFFETAWKAIDPVHPFQYETYDDIFYNVYSNLRDMMTIVGFLGFMAFVISILGLLGIVTYNAETRTREIGIRKVLGAGAGNLILLLARNEIIMLAVASVIGVPLSIWIAGSLLESFAYRISVGAGVVLPGLAFVYLVSALTIAVQTIRSTRVRLAEVLRYE